MWRFCSSTLNIAMSDLHIHSYSCYIFNDRKYRAWFTFRLNVYYLTLIIFNGLKWQTLRIFSAWQFLGIFLRLFQQARWMFLRQSCSSLWLCLTRIPIVTQRANILKSNAVVIDAFYSAPFATWQAPKASASPVKFLICSMCCGY